MVDAVSAAGASAPAKAAGFSGASAGADFETFLRMLTAQLRNQDPLNPMQGTDFAIQLATFAGVEQQAMTNKLLTQMAGQAGAGGASIAGWIGKEGRTTAPVWFSDRPITLEIAPDAVADSVQLVTRDAAGREITREEIGAGAGQIDWFGRDEGGAKLPDGQYAFTLESWLGGELIAETGVGAYGRIVEAAFTDDGPVIVFEGGGSAPASGIAAIRDPA